MTDSGLSTHCRLAKPGVFDGKVSGIFSGCRLEDFIQFYDCRRGRKWMGNDGVKGNGKGWQIGEIALPGKGKGIGRYWCDEKVGYWAREEKEMCPGGATCLPMLGNVLAPLGQRACPKTGQKTV